MMGVASAIGILAYCALLLEPGKSVELPVSKGWGETLASATQRQIVRERTRAQELGVDVAGADELALSVRKCIQDPRFELVVATRAGEAS